MLKSRKYLILYLAAAAVGMLLFSVRTSPIYPFELGDYGGNAAATGMLMGKYWLQGEIPYKDLVALGGPLYFLIQAAGWGMAERTGIFILQILNYFVFLLLMRKILLRFCRKKIADIFALLSVFPYIALCCGGDSTTEWGLALMAGLLFLALQETESERKNKKNLLAAGALCGSVFMLDPINGGAAYGTAAFLLLSLCGKCRGKKRVSYVAVFLLGAAIVCVPFLIYFVAHGCLNEMLRVIILYPLRGMVLESDLVVIVHKIVKCMLAFPLLAAGIQCCTEARKICREVGLEGSGASDKQMQAGTVMVVCAVFQIISLMLCRNDWYYYLANIPGMIVAAAVFVSVNKGKMKKLLPVGTAVLTVGICLQPLKNYCNYLLDGVPEVLEEFRADLESFQEENEECKILFLNTDSTWYLIADLKPEYRYFTDQTDLSSWDSSVAAETESYLAGENDVIISTEKGWNGQNFENYSLIQVYLKKRGNLCIYVSAE